MINLRCVGHLVNFVHWKEKYLLQITISTMHHIQWIYIYIYIYIIYTSRPKDQDLGSGSRIKRRMHQESSGPSKEIITSFHPHPWRQQDPSKSHCNGVRWASHERSKSYELRLAKILVRLSSSELVYCRISPIYFTWIHFSTDFEMS